MTALASIVALYMNWRTLSFSIRSSTVRASRIGTDKYTLSSILCRTVWRTNEKWQCRLRQFVYSSIRALSDSSSSKSNSFIRVAFERCNTDEIHHALQIANTQKLSFLSHVRFWFNFLCISIIFHAEVAIIKQCSRSGHFFTNNWLTITRGIAAAAAQIQ